MAKKRKKHPSVPTFLPQKEFGEGPLPCEQRAVETLARQRRSQLTIDWPEFDDRMIGSKVGWRINGAKMRMARAPVAAYVGRPRTVGSSCLTTPCRAGEIGLAR